MSKPDKNVTAAEESSVEPISKPESRQKADRQKDNTPRAKTPYLAMVLAISGVGLLIAGIWFIGQQWQAQQAQAEQLSVLSSMLEQQRESFQTERDAMSAAQVSQQEIVNLLSTQVQSLQLQANAQGVRLGELTSTSRADWFLAEASYLARLARQRLQTERSTKNPLALLQQVDDILIELDDLDVLSVRSAVAGDIAALRLSGDVDVSGTLLELNALISHVEHLPLLTYAMSAEEITLTSVDKMTGAEDRDVMQRWVAAIDELMTSLSNLVRVRQRAKPIEPILTDTEEAIARGNLRLMLQQASNAVLRERQSVYQASLMSAEQWIMDYFSDTKITRQVRERLQMLQSAEIVQKLPKIDATVNALDAFIIMRQRRLIQDLNEEDSLPRDRIGI